MAKSEIFHERFVRLPERDYPILIGRSILSDAKVLHKYVTSSQVLIDTNQVIASLYLHRLQEVFSDRQCDVIVLPDGEEHKNLQNISKIYDVLVSSQHHRDTTIIALGGGVIGDIAGFAASTFQRGVNFIQIPTTLLAQVDASVGGKTGVNHTDAKNMIGSFYQPKAVLIDLATLVTLPLRHLRAGLAEIIKYAILVGDGFYQEVLELLTSTARTEDPLIFLKSATKLPAIIDKCCQIKARVVKEDERESGARAFLNLGHTVGHALETYTLYTRWLHGEAVAIGLYCAALLSVEQGALQQSSLEKIDQMLALAGLPRRIPGDINLDHLRILMDKDKKIKNNRLRFILIRDFGDCFIEENVREDVLMVALNSAALGE